MVHFYTMKNWGTEKVVNLGHSICPFNIRMSKEVIQSRIHQQDLPKNST